MLRIARRLTSCDLRPTGLRSVTTLTQSAAISSNVEGSPKIAEQSGFLTQFIQTCELPQNSVKYFQTLPWTKPIFEAETHRMIPFYSRMLNESTGESRFFAQTVNTANTVPHVLGFCREDLQTPSPVTEPPKTTTSVDLSICPEFMCLMRFGSELESHPGIVNGGFQGVIFDEVMYCLLLMHQNNIVVPGPRAKHYTLDIMTKFRAPVRAPSDVLVRASLVCRMGRKWFMKADIVDCDGKVLTEGESWWLTARNPLS